MSTQTTLLESIDESSDESDTCPNGAEFCCGPEGITHHPAVDDGEEFEHEGHFPCFKCFMTACRNADSEVHR